jgi:hypothetical protein
VDLKKLLSDLRGIPAGYAEFRESFVGAPGTGQVQGDLSLESVARGIALGTGLLYALGLLVTNTWLLLFGVSDFELFNPRYVATGALAGTPIVVTLLLPRLSGSLWLWLVPLLLSIGLALVAGWTFADAIFLGAALWVLALGVGSLQPYPTARATGPAASTARRLSEYLIQVVPWWKPNYHWRDLVLNAILSLVLLIAYVGYFAWFFYPHIPRFVGGGQATLVRLFAPAESALTTVFRPTASPGPVVVDVYLVAELPAELIVVKDERTFRVPASEVTAIEVLDVRP